MRVRSTIAILLLGILVSGSLIGCPQESLDVKKHRHRARAIVYFEKGQYQEALIEFKNVVQIDNRDADGHYRLALTYLKLGGLIDFQQAFKELSTSVQLNAANPDAQLKLGQLYLLSNEPVMAREQAGIILSTFPQHIEGRMLLGRSLISERKFQEGIAELKKTLDLDPKNIHVYLDLARAYVQTRDFASAEMILNKALSMTPSSIEARLGLGDVLYLQGKADQAEIEYKKPLAIDPQNETLYVKLAAFYQSQNRPNDAEKTYLQLVAQKPREDVPLLLLGDFYRSMGEPDKALESFHKAVGLNGNSQAAQDRLISQLLDTGKLDEAATHIQAILQKNRKDYAGRLLQSRLLLAKDQIDEAIQSFRTLHAEKPLPASGHYFLGLALAQARETAQALTELNEAVKLAPRSFEAHSAMASMHLTKGSLDLAIDEAQAALQLNPRYLPAAITLGDAYLQKGDIAKAQQVFTAVTKALPSSPLPHYRLGLVSKAAKQFPEALAHFEESLRIDPHNIEPLSGIADILRAQGKNTLAQERVNQQLSKSPDNPLAYNLLGALYATAQEFDRAEAAFKKAIEVNASILLSYMNLADLYRRTGQLDQAAAEYERILSKNPQLAMAHTLLGIIYEQRRDPLKAKTHYEQALKFNPHFPPAANNLAWLLSEQGGNIDLALSYAEAAREQRPEDPYIADTLGWIYYKRHVYLKAIRLLKEAADTLSGNPVVLYHYGMAQYHTGDKITAKATLRTSLKISSDFPGSSEARQILDELDRTT